jgi:FkbM family methyltransferase
MNQWLRRQLKRSLQAVLARFGYRLEGMPLLDPNHINLLDLVLDALNSRKHGHVTFVQIGAHDGTTGDPLHRWITTQAWTGLLVEPQPTMFARLKETYAAREGLAFEQAAVAARTGEVTLYRVRNDGDPSWIDTLATFDRGRLARRWRRTIPDIETRIEAIHVPALTLQDLLDKHRIWTPDLLQIDTEGFDFEIIKMVDFRRHAPAVISYEHVNLSPGDQRSCRDLLASHGYHLGSYFIDTVACRPDLLPFAAAVTHPR